MTWSFIPMHHSILSNCVKFNRQVQLFGNHQSDLFSRGCPSTCSFGTGKGEHSNAKARFPV